MASVNRFETAKAGRVKLTKAVVDAAKAGHVKGQTVRLWDSAIRPLHLRITPSGTASYCIRFTKPGGGKSDFSFGTTDTITLEAVRIAAQEKIGKLASERVDPVEHRARLNEEARTRREAEKAKAEARAIADGETFDALAGAFMASCLEKGLRTRTLVERQWRLDHHIKPRLGARHYRELKRADLRVCLEAIQKTAAKRSKLRGRAGNRLANVCHADLKAIFNWAIDRDRIDSNPAAFKRVFDDKPVKRRGKMDDADLWAIWNELEAERKAGWRVSSALALQLCIVTLQRPNEIAKAHRSDFDWSKREWRIDPERNKTGDEACVVPLTDKAIELFKLAFDRSKSVWAFPRNKRSAKESTPHIEGRDLSHRFRKTRDKLKARGSLPSEDVQLYDARRFGRTRLEQKLGVSEAIAERVINHAEDRSMKSRYNVADRTPEIRAAHEAWCAELMRIVESPPPGLTIDVAASGVEAAA